MRSLAFALLPLAVTGCGQPAQLEVHGAWARDTAGGTANAAVFMTIASPAADRLIAASTPAAKKTALMTMRSGGGSMAMTYLDAIGIPAGKSVRLDPTGLHVWLEGLHRPLKTGQSFPLTLEFEKAGRRQVAVSVIAPAAPPPAPGTRGG